MRDQRTVTQLLVILSAEPGDNMLYETFHGMPFDVGRQWETNVPKENIFCCVYVTPEECASLSLRLPLARRLLMPGKGRWKCIPREKLNP